LTISAELLAIADFYYFYVKEFYKNYFSKLMGSLALITALLKLSKQAARRETRTVKYFASIKFCHFIAKLRTFFLFFTKF